MFPSSSLEHNFILFSSSYPFLWKIIITFLCQHSSMLTSSIIYVERNYNSSLNVIISLGPIPCFNFVTRMLYIRKLIIKKTKMYDCGWSINGCQKWSTKYETIRILEESDQVIFPTDKTNSFRTMDTEKYMTMVNEHLRCSSREIERDRVKEIVEKSRELLNEVGFQLSKSEAVHINESLKTKSIPTPKLLIKNHKKPNKNGEFPTRLVIPATNFTATFAKVGYLGLKAILDNHQVNYFKNTITQASQVKEHWEKLEWKREKVTIVSIDAVAMYPSIKIPIGENSDSYLHKELT